MTHVLFRRGALGDVVLLGSVTAGAPEPVHVVTDARYLSGDAAPVGGTSGSTDIRELLLVF